MATIQELRARAKAEYKRGKGGNSRLKGYGRMNKAQLLSALNMSEDKASQADGTPDRSSTASDVPSSPTRTKLLAAVKRKVDDAREKNPQLSEEQLRGVATDALAREMADIKRGMELEKRLAEQAEKNKPPEIKERTHQEFTSLGEKIAGDFTTKAKDIADRYAQLDVDEKSAPAYENDPTLAIRQNRAKDKRYSELVSRKLDLEFDDDDDRSALKSGKLAQDEYDRRKKKRESELKTIEEERELLAQKLDAEFKPSGKRDFAAERAALDNDVKAFTDRLIAHNGLSKDDAMALVKKTKLPKNADPELKEQMAEFYQLTGGKGSESLEKVVHTKERAYAIDDKIAIPKGDRETLLHEMAHHIEIENVRIRIAAAEWVHSKSTGKERPLNEITNSKNYDDDEWAHPGNYMHPYVGKVYNDYCTEVLSMGMEQFTSPRRLAKFAAEHPDHFAFLIGVLGSKKRA